MTDDTVYMLIGGHSYAAPEAVPVTVESDTYGSLHEALTEWLRRRNDWTGRYPGWGDGTEGGEVIVLGSEVDTVDAWTLVEAFLATGRDLDELTHYVEPADIAREAIAPTGSSDHQQVVWALRALEGYDAPDPLPGMPGEPALDAADEPAGRAIRREFPELDALVWDGSWLDLDAMGVDPEWVDALVWAIEDTGEVQWIDGEPFLIGVDVLRRQLQSR